MADKVVQAELEPYYLQEEQEDILQLELAGGGAGGAGGTGCCAGGGGYTGGSAKQEGNSNTSINCVSYNGKAGMTVQPGSWYSENGNHNLWNGGGYFEGPDKSLKAYSVNGDTSRKGEMYGLLGGLGSCGWLTPGHTTGNGGTAGKGGNVKVSENAKVYAFNGNMYTDGTDYQSGLNQCPIYLQRGIKNMAYTYDINSSFNENNIKLIQIGNGSTSEALSGYVNSYYSDNGVDKNKTIGIAFSNVTIDMSKQGIGSGAGYIEVSNGTYKIDNRLK